MVTTSAARIEANRKNAQKSTGPRTEEGKAASRMNALKHGMVAETVLPDAVAAEVRGRHEDLQREMAPKTRLGALLIKQIALMSVRSEKCAEQAIAANAEFVRHSKERFDRERIETAEELWEAIEQHPRGNLRKLREMPEGVELMVEVWEDLRLDLTREGAKPTWTAAHMVKAANLTGFKDADARNSAFGRLSRAFWGDFIHLSHEEGGWLKEESERKEWARNELVALIDLKIEELERHYATLDFQTIAQDRAEAPIRAQFDPSREASLARRYESAARRGFFKAIEEFRAAESIPTPETSPANHPSKKACGTLASSCAGYFANPGMPMPGMYPPHFYHPVDPRDEAPAQDDGAPRGRVANRPVL